MFRKVFSLFLRGNKYHCPVCEGSFSRFIKLGNGELLCPGCGSLPRDRRLYQFLANEDLLHGNMLDFSPSRALFRAFKKAPTFGYYSSDLSGNFLSGHHFDITAISKPDHFFDLVICYHVLEHISQDRQAMNELFRVLKPGGILLVQTPLREGATFEDPGIKTEEERARHFGQKDHVRIYSKEGLSDRLGSAGFDVTMMEFIEEPFNRSGFSEQEILFRCKK